MSFGSNDEGFSDALWHIKVIRGEKVYYNQIANTACRDRPYILRGGILADDVLTDSL